MIAQKYGIHWTMATIGKKLTRADQASRRGGGFVGGETGGAGTARATTCTSYECEHGGVGQQRGGRAGARRVQEYARGATAVNAVRGVSLAVEAGEMVAIVGPSGSGKSTLLNLLGALDRPSTGEVDDRRRAPVRARRQTSARCCAATSIGFVFQFFNLLPLLNARENVALPLLLAGVLARGGRAARRRAARARAASRARADHTPDQLSGGEMQRVAIARALSTQPVLLLADEPTGNLDSAAGAGVLALLKSAAREQRCAVVMVTHDPRAAAVADRVLEFGDGKLVGERLQPQSAPPSARNASVAESS